MDKQSWKFASNRRYICRNMILIDVRLNDDWVLSLLIILSNKGLNINPNANGPKQAKLELVK